LEPQLEEGLPQEVIEAALAAKQAAQQPALSPEEEAAKLQEKRAMLALGALIRYLVKNRADIRLTHGVMIFARQLYIVAVKDMELKVGAFTEKDRERWLDLALADAAKEEAQLPDGPEPLDKQGIFALVEEAFNRNARFVVDRGFEERDVAAAYKEVGKWLEGALAEHIRHEKAARRAQQDAVEQSRKARPVSLGTPFHAELQDKLRRDQPLVLVGWEPALRWLMANIMDYVVALADEQVYQVVRLVDRKFSREEEKAVKEKRGKLVQVSANRWKDCGRGRKDMEACFMEHILPLITGPMDLLVVDNLAWAASSTGIAVRQHVLDSVGRKAAAVNKILRAFCKDAGSAMVAGVPLPDTALPNFSSPVWDQLMQFSFLRGVQVVDAGECYDLALGRDIYKVSVPKADIDVYRTTNLILP
jgi:hypothetical protein